MYRLYVLVQNRMLNISCFSIENYFWNSTNISNYSLKLEIIIYKIYLKLIVIKQMVYAVFILFLIIHKHLPLA